MRPKILIVYNKSETSLLLRKMLDPEGYETLTAGSGRRALEMCVRDAPDLVLLASKTRDIEGLEFCRQLKKGRTTGHIPIILYSAQKEAGHRMLAYGAGVDDTLLEPFEITEVKAKVAAHLKRLVAGASQAHLTILHETNATKDRLLWLFSRVNHLLSDVLTTRGYKETIAAALGGALEMTGSDWASLAIHDARRGRLSYDHFAGIDPAPAPFAVALSPEDAAALAERPIPVVTNDYQAKGRLALFKSRGAEAFAGIPLTSEGELLGLLSVFRTEQNSYQEREEEQLLALAPVFSATLLKSGNDARIARLATQDSLTGLLNWHYGIRALQNAITGADAKPFAAARVDLINLRRLNEVHGFPAGDAILKQVGLVMQKNLPADAVAARSGKKFLLILPGQTADTAAAIAAQIVSNLESLKMQYRALAVGCELSAGSIAHAPGEALHTFYNRLEKCVREAAS